MLQQWFQSPIGTQKTRDYQTQRQLWMRFQSPIGTQKTADLHVEGLGYIQGFNPL